MALHSQTPQEGPRKCPLIRLLLFCLALPLAAAAAQGSDPMRTGGTGGGGGGGGHGAWAPWGPWSPCSSTCGGGAAFRTRTCLQFPEEQPCMGPPRQYRACDLEECPPGSVPFRDLQCGLYNGKPLPGGRDPYQWVPFHGAPNSCDLACLALGHHFYYTFGRALDGTRCGPPPSQDLCISGHCWRAGCDGTLGPDAGREDACGECNGRNASCLRVEGVFREAFPPAGFFGYKNVTRIPSGARHIKVTDRSRNYLALMDAQQRFLLNGDWTVDRPGLYPAAGTEMYYSRTADVLETLEAPGPTQEELTIMVLFQAPNPGIKFEFWVPKEGSSSPSALRRQQQTREAQGEHPLEAPTATAPPQREQCGKCPVAKGKSQRMRHYCSSDFVFRAQILSRRPVGRETRYDLRVEETYRNRFPLERREFAWAPGTCTCPLLEEGRHYLLMARRHVNFEGTLNRLLLPRGGYAQPWTPREDRQARQLAGMCP
nr:ADAMTS-like protein 5 [Anolis sagrei ordinatus]